MEPITPSTHHVPSRWKWVALVLAPILVALMLRGAMEVVENHLSSKVGSNTWRAGFALAMLGSMALVLLGSILWAFRARVVLTSNAMTVRGAILTRLIREEQIDGFRWIKGQMHLYLKDRQWPVQLSYYEGQHAINEWIFRRARDLGALELAEEAEAINRDLTLGRTDAQKEARLASLRKIVGPISVVAYCAAVGGVLNALFGGQAAIEKAAAAVLISIPVLLDLVALRNRGHVWVNHIEGTRYPQILSATMACGVALAVMSLFDEATLLGNAFYRWFLPVAVAKGLLWLAIDFDRPRMLESRGWFLSTITALCLMIVPSFWVAGSIYQLNKHLDNSGVTWNATEVVDKRVSRGKTVTYYVEVAPWASAQGKLPELVVSRQRFERLQVGMSVGIGVRRGALAIPWVAGISLAEEKRQ